MKINSQRVAALLLLAILALALLGCQSDQATNLAEEFSPTPDLETPAPGAVVPAPVISVTPNPAYAIAQVTLDSGQNSLLDLARQATVVSQNMTQAANASALSTQAYNQRQKVDLDFQATEVSLAVASARATQDSVRNQMEAASLATAAALSGAATATQSANQVNATQTAQVASTLTAYPMTATSSVQEQITTGTAQAQAILNAEAQQTAEAMATRTAYPMTATPLAVTQAAGLMQEYGREQSSFVDDIVVPLVPIIATLDLTLFVLVIVVGSRQYILRPNRLFAARIDANQPPFTIEGIARDYIPRRRVRPLELMPANPQPVHVEMMNATEPPVDHWIAEVERQLTSDGGPLL